MVVVVPAVGVPPVLVMNVFGLFASQLDISPLKIGLSQSLTVERPETPVKYAYVFPQVPPRKQVPALPAMRKVYREFAKGRPFSACITWSMVAG
jgi:hypothetical protein